MKSDNGIFWNRGMSSHGSLIKNPSLTTVSRSKNLRGLLDYGRRHRVGLIEIRRDWVQPEKGRGLLRVTYLNGNVGYATFECYAVLCGWVKARGRRAWSGVSVINYSEEVSA